MAGHSQDPSLADSPQATRARLTRISCPVQRVLAGSLREIEDLFSAEFARLPPETRLANQPGEAYDGAEAFRNAVRMMALGCAVRLGLDLGLAVHALHGHKSGYTEIAELAPMHYATNRTACRLFDAVLADQGDLGRFVAQRYAQIRDAAQAQAQGMVRVVPVAPRNPVGHLRPHRLPRGAEPGAVVPGPDVKPKRRRKKAGAKRAA